VCGCLLLVLVVLRLATGSRRFPVVNPFVPLYPGLTYVVSGSAGSHVISLSPQ
jgi:hypothetical protein